MILSDKLIRLYKRIFFPFEEKQVNPASYDLRWSGRVRRPNPDKFNRVIKTWDKEELKNLWLPVEEYNELYIHPGEFVLLDTYEAIEIPIDLCGLLMLKSSSGRFGLEHLHAGFFDPGFGLDNPSTGTLEVTNKAPWIICIKKHQSIVQLVLMKMLETPEKDYRVTGRYNGQIIPEGAR